MNINQIILMICINLNYLKNKLENKIIGINKNCIIDAPKDF